MLHACFTHHESCCGMLEKKLRKVLERLQQVHHVRIASAMSYLGVVMSIAINFSGIFNRRYLSNRFILSMASILAAQQVRSLSAISPLQIGLTGSIGMGKSTCTKHFRAMGFPVFDADAAVHELYSLNGAAVEPIGRLFPDAIVDSAVSRPILASKIRDDITVLKALEEIVHPLVVAKRRQFFETAESEGNFMVVYDIPLLLENPANHNVDYTVVATASAGIQRSRVLSRPGMTEERFETLLSKQMPDEKKRELSDYLIHTDHESYAPSRAQVAKIVASIIEKNPAAWSQWKSRTTTTASNMNNAGTGTPIAECSLSKRFDLVVFDLDDTLVPVWNPIKPAKEAMFNYMDEHMPLTAATARESLRVETTKISAENVLLAHDLTEVTRLGLTNIATPFNEQHKVDDTVKHFVAHRSLVAPHLYDDVIPCLDFLTKDLGVRVAVLTNGNANLTSCTALGKYLTLTLGAGEVGSMKPSPIPFIAISQRTGIPPSRILFVGDSFENDVVGAHAVGMTGGLLLRENFKVQQVQMLEDNLKNCENISKSHKDEYANILKHHDYIIFNTLFPEEIKEKVDKFFKNRNENKEL